MAMQVFRHAVAAGEAGRADLVVRAVTGLSRSAVRGLFDAGCVRLNGAAAPAAGAPVAAGDVIEVSFDAHRRYSPRPRPLRDSPFRILHEDARILVVDKKAGVLTVPTDAGETDTLVHALGAYLGRGRPARVEVVHRLDREASGLLVFAKDAAAAEALREQFEAHAPERSYLALVAGKVAPPEGTYRSRLTTDWKLQRRSETRPGRGEPAVTHYRTEGVVHGATFVRVRLETGRRNQIRVQFAEAGHPVLGDRRYGPDRARHPRWTFRRLALHAAVLGFRHPETGAALKFESPLPRAFREFLTGGAAPRPAPAGRRPQADT